MALSIPHANPLGDGSAAGARLELTNAHNVVPLVRARGSMFLVTTREGNVTPRGARELGLFDRDTRFLSHYEMRVQSLDMVYLSDEVSGDSVNQVDLMLASGEESAFLDDPANFVHIRRRQMLDDVFVEELSFTNYLGRELSFEVVISFGADFADMFEVRGAKRARRGELRPALVKLNDVDLSYDGLDGVRYTTSLCFDPIPDELTPSTARFCLRLAPGERRTIEAVVRPLVGSQERMEPIAFSVRKRRLDEEAHGFRSSCTKIRCDNGVLQQTLDRALADLFALRVRAGDGAIVAAGIPWFCCPFGRDSLLASYEALTLTPRLAIDTLRVLAAHQGRRFDPYTEEEPGKILHEMRFGEMARVGETPHRPYYGSVDSTPLFVVVAHGTYEMTGDLGFVHELQPALLAALSWVDAHTHEGRALVTYERRSEHGLDNQGWKDSKDAVVFPNGKRASPPIALCEVQGYCVSAYATGSRLLHALGQTELAGVYAARAERMLKLVESTYWMEDLGRYAYAIDGEGGRVPTVVSNLGHLLWSRVPTLERARAVADLLVGPASFSGFGIRTLSADQPAYNPLSYHNGTIWPHDNAIIAQGFAHYGLRSHALKVFDGILAALEGMHDRRLPELFCGLERSSGGLVRYPVACSPQAWAAVAPYLLLSSVLGLTIDAPSRQIYVRDPCLPASLRELVIERMQVGNARVSMAFTQRGRRCDVDILDIEGGEVRTLIELG
ncbi:MAG: amylo-alpha-1,6-glucosidase [Polyangiaceae bacterium]|nr:amylo-alpha-1,6-glucosidase [Polyangiaceae bacterium]